MIKRLRPFLLALLLLPACSTSNGNQFQTLIKNLTSAQCANPQATLQNIPTGFLTPAQAQQALELVCAGMYGTTAAPATAVGQQPVLK